MNSLSDQQTGGVNVPTHLASAVKNREIISFVQANGSGGRRGTDGKVRRRKNREKTKTAITQSPGLPNLLWSL